MDAVKKKPALALVVGDEEESPKKDAMESPKDEDAELDAAAGELWDAIQNGDEDAFKSAVRAVKAC